MAAPESKAEQIIEAIRYALQAIPPTGYWYVPTRVARFQKVRDSWLREVAYPQTLYLVAPGFEREVERATGQIDFEMDLTVAGLRTYPWGDEDPFNPPETIVAAAPFANGALTVAAQPLEPSQLLVLVTDANASLTAGVLTLTGTDPEGAALVATLDLATQGRIWAPLGCFKTLTSAVITDMAGGTSADTVRILSGASRWQQQNRMVRDVIKAVGFAKQLSDPPFNLGFVTNVMVADVDRNVDSPAGWSLVFVHLTISYGADRTAP